mmetsp:Transcript_3564/g.5547  ORF Transcript_3564/g.5547 Transcript_3564/m.5547 type:complete len:880 (+) Transcript_3564:126-2765(+)|eukprot:CAMPEP_0185031968 /NCGR_PEP_ID=MMETSP1103-20130426/19763_1 /TAXON_ID=36769 /ORGANISM="Paraphysomonas bandaiensis, Strain Caron Lab Isolate" /LENGTH=879 /DNA_ID=CAMNT_0027567691 /DNA_START=54 /DNA_END=2693 /DNA_ORIENTATION=+
MSLKRENSKSVTTLQRSVKRLAIAEDKDVNKGMISSPTNSPPYFDGYNVSPVPVSEAAPMASPGLEPVLSTSRDDFDSSYERLSEIGRGGFSVVYKCRHRTSGEVYAVKVIDLRPLRLREKFNPMRLRREVDIMRRLRHPNIIQFVEVYETPDQLMVVMEYAPGRELFDVILERKFFTEDDAKPIFAQIASALQHLHSMDIIHRDIKPENILILNQPDPHTGLPIAKLLDFGLSKHAGLGSAAKTFVGTPCYLAPEVEFTAKGIGGTYGSPADCWSLGAVLYVMLVARFPEFDHNVGRPGRMVLRLPPALWSDKSAEAKSLIQGLMCYETDVRLGASDALRHEWLDSFRVQNASQRTMNSSHVSPHGSPSGNVMDMILCDRYTQDGRMPTPQDKSNYRLPSGVSLPKHPLNPSGHDSAAPPLPLWDAGRDMGLTVGPGNGLGTVHPGQYSGAEGHLPLAPLLHLQKNIAGCFENASKHYAHNQELSSHVRAAAVMCRQQISDSTKMLRKIEQTAFAVLNMFPDLELAVEEGEPQLAVVFFDMVREWVSELLVLVSKTQSANQSSISQLQHILDMSNRDHQNRQKLNSLSLSTLGSGGSSGPTTIDVQALRDAIYNLQEQAGDDAISGNAILELFLNLFGQDSWRERGLLKSYPNSPHSSPHGRGTAQSRSEGGRSESSGHSSDVDEMVIGAEGAHKVPPKHPAITSADNDDGAMDLDPDNNDRGDGRVTRYGQSQQSSDKKDQTQMDNALEMLRKVDLILEQLGVFWANTEVVLDALTKKGQHAEHFVTFARNPNLMARFRDRMMEYRRFWEGVTSMCHTYLMGIVETDDSLSRFSTPPEEILSSLSSTSSATSPPPSSATPLSGNGTPSDVSQRVYNK